MDGLKVDSRLQIAIPERLEQIRRRISESGRDPNEVTIVAIGKGFGPEHLIEAYKVGVSHFGENRYQEAARKIPLLPSDITWHFVGHLQTNKASAVVSDFSWIHSLDRPSIISEISKQAEKRGVDIDCFLQINLAGEETKSGCAPAEVMTLAESLITSPGIVPSGLMTIPPLFADPEKSRPYFRELAKWRQKLQDRFGPEFFSCLSMGMTDDYYVAVEEGATHIRIGRGLFGPRPT